MTVTCDEFLASVKRLITAPTNIEDEDILAIATDIMRDTIVPMMTGVNEEYFMTKGPAIPIVTGQTSYRIPSRAVARKLREIKIMDGSGTIYDFPKVSINRKQVFQNGSIPFGFHFLGDRIELTSTPTTSGYSLLLYYPRQPGKLWDTASAGIVSGVSGDDVTLVSVPTALVTNAYVDFIEAFSGNWYLGIDGLITNVAGNTLSFGAGIVPTDLAVGDYLPLRGQSPVLQIPDEGAPLLQAMTAHDMLYATSDFEGQKNLLTKIKEQKENFLKVISPRISGEPTIIVNDRGLLRGRRSAINARFRGE